MKKILVVTPRFPYPESGACEQDRAEGIRQLQRLGFTVRVIGKVFSWQDKAAIKNYWQAAGVTVQLVEYKYDQLDKKSGLKKLFYGLRRPRYLDGAAFEYTDPEINRVLTAEITDYRPELVWFDYTYLWPLYAIVKKAGLPIVTRSINVEHRHFLDEAGRSMINYLKTWPKFGSEKTISRLSDLVFAINPEEEKFYEEQGAWVKNLPLRALPKKLGTHTPGVKNRLSVFFSGSTYNVAHNRRALEFIIKDIAPRVRQKYEDKFVFYLTGTKFPAALRSYLSDTIVHSRPDNYEEFLAEMDIALVPSFFGAGMQQKIFEPLARGFPTITHARGLAGYDFLPGKEVLIADSRESFCQALKSLQSLELRQELSANAKAKSKDLFSQAVLDQIVSDGLSQALTKNSEL